MGDKVRAFESQWESDCLEINDKGLALEMHCCLAGGRDDSDGFESVEMFPAASHAVSTRPGIPRIPPPLHGLDLLFPPSRHKLWAVKQALWFLWTIQIETVQVRRGNPI